MDLTVTQKNIDAALEIQETAVASDTCPIAQALKQLYPDHEVEVSHDGLCVLFYGSNDINFEATAALIDFMNAFDLGKPVTAQTFVLTEREFDI